MTNLMASRLLVLMCLTALSVAQYAAKDLHLPVENEGMAATTANLTDRERQQKQLEQTPYSELIVRPAHNF